MKSSLWTVVSVFIGLAVFVVLVIAFFNFGFIERVDSSSDQSIQRHLFDSNTITFMSSFILVVMFSVFIGTQDKLASQSREFEKQTEKMEKEKAQLISSIKHTRQINSFIFDSQAIGDKCILLLYMIHGSYNGQIYSLNQTIRSTFSECNNGICDLGQRLNSYKEPIDTHERHDILSPLVSSFHKFQAFQRFNKKNLDPVLAIYIDDLISDFNELGVK